MKDESGQRRVARLKLTQIFNGVNRILASVEAYHSVNATMLFISIADISATFAGFETLRCRIVLDDVVVPIDHPDGSIWSTSAMIGRTTHRRLPEG